MKQIALILIFSLFIINTVFGQSGSNSRYDLAIRNVDVFDSKSKQILKNKTILINGDTIASIIDSSQKYKASKTIKGNGRLVVPGFIDTHTHILQTYGKAEMNVPKELAEEVLEAFKKLTARQYLSNGITTIIDMAQPESWVEKSVEFQKNPTPEYPNYFINGSSTISDLSWDRNPPAHHEKIFSAEDGRKKVQKYARLGIKHMKLYWKLEEADMKAVVDEANKYGITLNAHVDNNIVTIPQAMDLGVRNFEHFFTLVPSVLNFREVFPSFQKKFGVDDDWNIDKFAANMVFHFKYIEDDAELNEKLLDLFDRMAKEKVSISTALNVLATAAEKSYSFSTFDPIPPRNSPQTNYSEKQKQQLSEAFDSMMKYMKVAHEKGVKLRIGTDTRYGGDAFISELLLFSEAGFPIEDVLQIATLNGAEAMKIDDKFGSIEVGKKADLVMFEKNPFNDYKNFQSKKTVIKGGTIFELKESAPYILLDKIEAKGLNSGLKWFSKNKNNRKYGKFDEAEMNEIIFQLFSKGKVTEAVAVSRLSKQIFPNSVNVYNGLSEDQLNNMGYNYLGKDQKKFAVEIFKLNVELNPTSANVYDSLGEAYLSIENKELALKNYKKAVELNPQNYNAVNVINKLEGRIVTVAESILDTYVGEYQINPQTTIIVSKEAEKLFWQQKGRDNKLELEPISNERFVFAGTSQSVLFEKDSGGIVSGITLYQNGRQIKLTRPYKIETVSDIPISVGINQLKNKADSKKFDQMIGEFMQKYSLPGLSVAFAKDGELKFASGYGFADKDLKEKVNIKHRFRIASISKPITSAAILTLVEQKKISLNDKVFGKDGTFKGKYLTKPNANIELIEVRHLLQHTAAPEWSNRGNFEDPMFVHFELSQGDLIRKTLEERTVSNKPGMTHAYSNFGYCVLGRVIEQVSGKTYETFVKDLVSEHNINSFAITGDGLAARAKDEVFYFFENPNNPNVPYSFPAARMDAHGGWITTAVDMVKFGLLVDGVAEPKDILSLNTIEMMKKTTDVSKEYGFGWEVDSDGNSSHSGSLPGTSSTLMNTKDGMTWCILANARGTDDTFYDELEGLMWKIIKDIEL